MKEAKALMAEALDLATRLEDEIIAAAPGGASCLPDVVTIGGFSPICADLFPSAVPLSAVCASALAALEEARAREHDDVERYLDLAAARVDACARHVSRDICVDGTTYALGIAGPAVEWDRAPAQLLANQGGAAVLLDLGRVDLAQRLIRRVLLALGNAQGPAPGPGQQGLGDSTSDWGTGAGSLSATGTMGTKGTVTVRDLAQGLGAGVGDVGVRPRVRCHLLMAWAAMITGEHSRALDSINEALGVHGETAGAWRMLGEMRWRAWQDGTGPMEEALRAYAVAWSMAKHSEWSFMQQGTGTGTRTGTGTGASEGAYGFSGGAEGEELPTVAQLAGARDPTEALRYRRGWENREDRDVLAGAVRLGLIQLACGDYAGAKQVALRACEVNRSVLAWLVAGIAWYVGWMARGWMRVRNDCGMIEGRRRVLRVR